MNMHLRLLGFSVFFLAAGITHSNTILAQDIRLSRDTVLVDDAPMAIFQSLGTITKQMYVIKNVQGDPLILIDQSQLRDAEGNALLRFMFTGYPDKQAFMPVSLQFRRRMMRTLVAYNLIQKGQLNEKTIDLFCQQYPGFFETNRLQALNDKPKAIVEDKRNYAKPEETKPIVKTEQQIQPETSGKSDTPTPIVNPEIIPNTDKVVEPPTPPASVQETASTEKPVNYSLVNRDIDQPIYLDGNVIRQDFEEIGLYTVEQMKIADQPYYVISIYDIRHDAVAEAIVPLNEKIYEFKTFKDSKTRRANVADGDVYETVKSCAVVLSQLLYL